MSFTDTMNGGCNLTVASTDAEGRCYYESRTPSCSAGDTMRDIGCVGNEVIDYRLNSTVTECPASESEYMVPAASDSDVVFPVQLTLFGAASTWGMDDPLKWTSLTNAYAGAFFNAYPDYGYSDVVSDADIFAGETIVDMEGDSVTLFFMQSITWRSDAVNVTGAMLLAELYNSENGKAAYLNALQSANSTALPSVTEVADVQVLQFVGTEAPTIPATEPDAPTEEDVGDVDEGDTSETQETDTIAPTVAPEESIGLTVTTGEGEAVPSPTPSSAHSTLVRVASGLALVVSAAVVF